ncbi:SDR family oxidoreductase [Rhizobiales bacterium RZME27]|uniref:SDR family oxidoreductase n=1 Tax=Endobacterium cereale TaxID=2663029 RepID=A0A6A8AI48_9HYPH|nr:SDR family oxidoreductase [Endobacterium cereale]
MEHTARISRKSVDLPVKSPRTVLVTGAARRIGAAICSDLAAHGFAVAIHANEAIAEAESLAARLRQDGAQAIALRANLLDPSETADLIGRVAADLGPLDLLVNNASIFREDNADQFDAEAFEQHFSIHVKAPSILSSAFLAQLPQAASGLIVNVIDQRVWALTPRFYSYTLSKSALWTATQTLAQAYGPRVRVNAIGPGPSFKSPRQSDEDFQTQLSALILKQGPAPEEFGATIRFLFNAPSITGQMVALDGGQHLAWQTPDVAEINE